MAKNLKSKVDPKAITIKKVTAKKELKPVAAKSKALKKTEIFVEPDKAKELGNQILPNESKEQGTFHLSKMQQKRMKRFERRKTNVTAETFKDLASETWDVRYKDVIFTEGFEVTEHEYKPGMKFLCYVPKGDNNKKRCWIMGLHAGGGKPEDMQQWANDFTRLGYVYFSPEFRIKEGEKDKFTPEEQKQAIYDMFDFIYYIRKHSEEFGIKKKKGFSHGISAGAIVTVEMGILITVRKEFAPDANQNKMQLLATASNSGAAIPEYLAMIPAAAVTDLHTDKKQMPPNYFFNGEDDHTVEFSEAVKTQQSESMNGVPSLYHWFPNTGHKLGNHDFILDQMINFFFSYIKEVKS